MNRSLLFGCALFLGGVVAFAQTAAIGPPRDVAYPGTIRLNVDATDIRRHIFSVRETIPVRGGDSIVLLYPQWLPGNHSPAGRIDKFAGFTIRAGGTRLEWIRDAVDVFAFHVNIPAAATALDIEFQFLSPVEADQGRMVMTPEMLNLQWNSVVLYPAGYFARQITVEPSVRLPEGWQFATALETASTSGGIVTFKPLSLENLVDSPMFAGRYFKRLDLDAGGPAPVRLNVVADRAALLEIAPEQLAAHRGPGAPLDGIGRGGYKLVYTETPSDYFKDSETRRRVTDLTYSLGMVAGSEGTLTDVMWDGLAFQNGLTAGTQIVAVNGTAYSGERLKDAVKDANKNRQAIELLLKNGDQYRTVRMDYHDGLRYPHLERSAGSPARLDEIFAPAR